jgi:hypothetical protein
MAKKKKNNKDKLSAGADEIKKAQDELKKVKPEPVVLEPLTRSIQEILTDRVTILEGNLGLELSQDTTIEESLAVLDYTTQMSDHVGFMIGDVLNFSQTKWGDKYTVALNQTHRALSTLKGYAEASRRIPAAKRQAALSFTAHREILRLPDDKMDVVLKEVGKQAEKGEAPTTKVLRLKVQKLTPKKRKAPKKATSGKSKKKSKPEPPPYQPDADEQAHMDAAEEAIEAANESVKSGGVFKIVAKCDNKEKQRWVKMLEPFVTLYNNLDRITGY